MSDINEGEDSTLAKKIETRARSGGHVRIGLADGTAHQAYMIGDYEIEEPEWPGDEGSFWTRIEFPEAKEPNDLAGDQYPTQLGGVSATITGDGWEEIELWTDVQRVEDGDLERWESILLGKVESVEPLSEDQAE
ncbi:hypothetical protein ACFQDD_00895 [Halorubrum pallidum]|uniref:Uncharacterized protein n=1 Tax=Halorubrum pallidum TaxID=1526114 RepID=A0ABD5SYS1_9EURY